MTAQWNNPFFMSDLGRVNGLNSVSMADMLLPVSWTCWSLHYCASTSMQMQVVKEDALRRSIPKLLHRFCRVLLLQDSSSPHSDLLSRRFPHWEGLPWCTDKCCWKTRQCMWQCTILPSPHHNHHARGFQGCQPDQGWRQDGDPDWSGGHEKTWNQCE